MSEPVSTLHPEPAQSRESPGSLFLNRELSWLEFNRRVLHEAEDPRNPLLERLKFLAIFDNNLDEFFMKRVGGLKQQLASQVLELPPDGLTPRQQLATIDGVVRPLVAAHRRLFNREILPALSQHGLEILSWEALRASEARFRAMADNIPQLAWMTDRGGAITWYNKRWFEYTGTTLEEAQRRAHDGATAH